MFDEGQAVGLGVMWPVEIYGQWHTLAATASSWVSEASAAAAEMESAAASWTGLVSSYREAETQEVVRTALDEAPEVTREWADVTGRAADVLQSFATEANGLQQQAAALEGQAARLQGRLWASGLLSGGDDDDTSAEDAALRREIERHNDDVMALNSRWQQLEQQTASEIDSIAGGGGYQDEIPVINTGGATFGPAAGGLGAGGLGAGGFGFGAGGALAGGPLNGGAGLGLGFHSAVAHMIRSGNDDPVETATELYDTVTSDDVTGADMQAFYDQLGEMDGDQIEEFAEANPQINQYSMPQPANDEQLASWPSGKDGANWWDTMDENGTQNAMLAFLPLLTGNTQGIKYEVRDTANRNALDRLRASGDLSANQRERLDGIQESLDDGDNNRMLLSLDMGQDPTTPGPRADPAPADPLAAVSVGNPDSADTTTFDVAGMFSDTEGMSDEVRGAQHLYNGLEDSSNEHAVVSWIGYDSPGYGTVLGEGKADNGSWALAYALDGYRETTKAHHEDGDTRVNVNAHSYGTNTATYALSRTTYDVDTYTMYGSAGIDAGAAEHASELNVAKTDEGRPAVYATDANNDSTSDIGKTLSGRADPTDTDFGAYVFSADGTGNPPGYPIDGHSQIEEAAGEYGYRDRNSQVYESLLLINDDSADEVDLMTESTVEYYEGLFDQHVETKMAGQYRGNTYYPGTEYEVSLDGETQRVETRDEAMKLVNDHYAEQPYNRADAGDVQAETTEQYYQSLAEHEYDEHVVRRVADQDSGYSLVPRTELEVTLDGQSHRVQTRDEAIKLISEYYATQAEGPGQGNS